MVRCNGLLSGCADQTRSAICLVVVVGDVEYFGAVVSDLRVAFDSPKYVGILKFLEIGARGRIRNSVPASHERNQGNRRFEQPVHDRKQAYAATNLTKFALILRMELGEQLIGSLEVGALPLARAGRSR